MKRAKHSLSHYRMVTAGMGELFPVGCVPVLPGDTIQHSTSALVRVTPLNTPVMHPVSVRIHHWFLPNRILWPESEGGGWESFITGGKDGLDAQTVPQDTVSTQKKSVTAYLGAPPLAGQTMNALPIRAFNKVYNERYRDQDLVTERNLTDKSIPRIAWEKDYFGVARPFTQKGPDISLPIAQEAEIKSRAPAGQAVNIKDGNTGVTHPLDTSGPSAFMGTAIPGMPDANKLYADQPAQLNINDFRTGFALQRYQEARARYGSRFTEYLRYLGITPSDARLQDPEFLGGGNSRLSFSEVLQTTPASEAGTAGVGDLYGHGIAGARTPRYRKFFEEHGYVMSLMSVRPKAIYQNGIPREFLKKTKEDFYQRELAHLGQQEIYKRELYAAAADTDVFGFTDRYEEYRHQPSQVSQDFGDLLNSWHLARELSTDVTLNQSFTDCAPSNRIYQVQTNDPLWIMVNHKIVARRMVPKRANPRVL